MARDITNISVDLLSEEATMYEVPNHVLDDGNFSHAMTIFLDSLKLSRLSPMQFEKGIFIIILMKNLGLPKLHNDTKINIHGVYPHFIASKVITSRFKHEIVLLSHVTLTVFLDGDEPLSCR